MKLLNGICTKRQLGSAISLDKALASEALRYWLGASIDRQIRLPAVHLSRPSHSIDFPSLSMYEIAAVDLYYSDFRRLAASGIQRTPPVSRTLPLKGRCRQTPTAPTVFVFPRRGAEKDGTTNQSVAIPISKRAICQPNLSRISDR